MELPKRKSYLAWQKFNDDFSIIIDSRTSNSVYQLNSTATLIWDLCDGQHSPADMAKKISFDFDISDEEALKDINEIFANFTEHNLLE